MTDDQSQSIGLNNKKVSPQPRTFVDWSCYLIPVANIVCTRHIGNQWCCVPLVQEHIKIEHAVAWYRECGGKFKFTSQSTRSDTRLAGSFNCWKLVIGAVKGWAKHMFYPSSLADPRGIGM